MTGYKLRPEQLLIRSRMTATGIGFAGIDGAWWLPAAEPFRLPVACRDQLQAIGDAIFILLDVVTALYGTAEGAAGGVTHLLDYKVPPHILRLMHTGRVESVRPDFQLVLERDAQGAMHYRFVATELEICPSAHGFAHAMQVGYGLMTDLVHAFAQYLDGRELLFVGTEQWSEFLLEQLAFCRALAVVGARGRVLYDRPFRQLADEVERCERWQPPIFGVKQKPSGWQDHLWSRLGLRGLASFVYTPDDPWPASVGNAVVFRFGYFDCFAPDHLRRFVQWQEQGAILLNPTQFVLDSKGIMAALQLPAVRQRIANESAIALTVLDRALPETILLTPESAPRILADKDEWVVKFAGYDRGQQAWGGRSLQIGTQHTTASWQSTLQQYITFAWPVVAQRIAPSVQVDIAYLDSHDQVQWMHNAHSRLRVFYLRDSNKSRTAGAHLTLNGGMLNGGMLNGGTIQVSEATDAVQAPILFVDA